MKSVIESKVLPQESKIMLLAEYIEEVNFSSNENFSEFTFLGHDNYFENKDYSILFDFILVKTVSEDDLEWGEKGHVKVTLFLTNEKEIWEKESKSFSKEYSLIGKETSKLDTSIRIGVSEIMECGFDGNVTIELSGASLIDIEIFRNQTRDKVIFLMLGYNSDSGRDIKIS